MLDVKKAPMGTNPNAMDTAASGAHTAIDATQRATNSALNSLSDSVDRLHEKAAPALSAAASKIEQMAKGSYDSVLHGYASAKERAVKTSDDTVAYIKDEPVKSVMIAAATGAAVAAVMMYLMRSKDR